MACGLSFALKASDGQCWRMTMNAAGQMVATLITDASPVVLKDYYGTLSAYSIDVVNGMLTTTTAGYSASLPSGKNMSDPAGSTWTLLVDQNGLLYTLLSGAAAPAVVIGQCLGNAEYPPVVQPVIGQPPTAPVQSKGGGPLYSPLPDEETGKFSFGCAHWANHIDVRRQAVNCTPSILLTCPVCGWLQRTMTVADFYDQVNNAVTVA